MPTRQHLRRAGIFAGAAALLAVAFAAGSATAQGERPAKGTFIYFIEPVRGEQMVTAPTQEESAKVAEHFQHLVAKFKAGELILAGPSTAKPYTGIVVFEADNPQAAQAFLDADPAVAAGVFEGRLAPFSPAILRGRDEGRFGG